LSANYRTLPESTGFDLSEDLLDAYRYVSTPGKNGLSHELNKPSLVDPSRIIIAEHSGGGYCALKATLEVLKILSTSLDLKKPIATVAVYPMLDFLSAKWSCEGIDLGPSEEDFEAGRKDLERGMASKKSVSERGSPTLRWR
jgi:acetyl esterase/lipase